MRLPLCCLLIALGPASAAAQSMFRANPAHSGVYTGGGPTLVGLAWRARTGGDVVSSPTIDGGVVYVGSDDGSLYALDLATGATKWKTALGSPVSSAPATGSGLVFAATRDGVIAAVDAATGQGRWRVPTGPLARLPWGHESGDYYISSPTVVGNVVLAGGQDGVLYAIDTRSGRVKWRAQTGARIRATPAVDGQRVFAGSFDGRVYCFDLATGAQIWRYETLGTTLNSGDFGFDRRSIQSSPAVMNGVVYIGARDGFVYALDEATGTKRWSFDQHISWINSSPAAADGVIYDGSSDSHFLQALDSTGHELWRASAEGIVWSSPAVAGDVVYAGDGTGRLYAWDRRTGAPRWVFRTGAAIFSSPSVSGDHVVVGSSDGSVYALRATSSTPIDRVVFLDTTRYDSARVAFPTASRYLAARGYHLVDANGLERFFEQHAEDARASVVVFGMDYVPGAILAGGASSRWHSYLAHGGKVVWMGPPPGIFPPQTDGKISLDWARASELTGAPQDSALFDVRGARPSTTGELWGLPPRWRDSWSVEASGVTAVLGMDEWGLASSWVKNFGGPEGTGFVHVPADDPFALYLVAEYRGG